MKSAGAFLWFNWKTLSDKGHTFYAKHIYHQLIPLFAPNAKRLSCSCSLFDGDFLSSGIPPPVNPEDRDVYTKIADQGLTNMYVIGIFGEAEFDLLDTSLKKALTSYCGMQLYPAITGELFYAYSRGMALIPAIRIRDRMFKKISFDFMSDEQLISLGFTIEN